MRTLVVLLALVALAYARTAAKQASVLPVRRISPAIAPVREAADAALAQLNALEGKKMELVTVVSAATGIRGDAHMFYLSLMVKDSGATLQRDVTVSLVPPSKYTLVSEDAREL